MKNLELKNILITFISDNENIIRSLENDLEFLMEQNDDEVDKEGISEQINEQIDFRNDLIRDAKFILKDIRKEIN